MVNSADITVVLPVGPLVLNREAAAELLALLLDAYAERIAQEEHVQTEPAA
jgi:hypothetical protein